MVEIPSVYNDKPQKCFLNENKCMEPLKTNQLDGNDTTTLSHHPYILCHLAAAYTNMICVSYVHKVMEGSVVGSAGSVCACMGSRLCCGWLQCTMYLLYTEHGRYGLSCLYA